MIRITAGREKIMLTGHAGYAPKGQDIVCAAVSALTENLKCSIERLTHSSVGFFDDRSHYEIVPYHLDYAGTVLLSSYILGLSDIAETYPKYVQIEAQAWTAEKAMDEQAWNSLKSTGKQAWNL